MTYSATILADSIASGVRLTTVNKCETCKGSVTEPVIATATTEEGSL